MNSPLLAVVLCSTTLSLGTLMQISDPSRPPQSLESQLPKLASGRVCMS
jgi:hypothetical protein